MAELRATDIIDKLRKINNRIKELEVGAVTKDSLKEQGVVFEIKVNDTSYSPADGVVDLGSISGGGDNASAVVCAYIKTPLININSYSVADQYVLSSNTKKDDEIFAGYDYYTITSQSGRNSYGIYESEAATYFGAMIGSKYVPKIVANNPQYHYMITEDGDIYLPILYKNVNNSYSEIRLYIIRWISKAVKDYVDSVVPEIQIGGTQPTKSSYKIWIDI